jgi:hypothetical protein
MVDAAEETAKVMLDRAMKDVREQRRARGELLHGWKREAAILAVVRALNIEPQSAVGSGKSATD